MIVPGGSGRDVVDHVLARRPGTRALFVSGYAPESLRLRGLFDVREILEKPFRFEDLAHRIRRALDSASPPRTQVPPPGVNA